MAVRRFLRSKSADVMLRLESGGWSCCHYGEDETHARKCSSVREDFGGVLHGTLKSKRVGSGVGMRIELHWLRSWRRGMQCLLEQHMVGVESMLSDKLDKVLEEMSSIRKRVERLEVGGAVSGAKGVAREAVTFAGTCYIGVGNMDIVLVLVGRETEKGCW
ncbi:hypothetical protein CAPTEDRAFT_215909 [Capitella teleta]|uniref:Uncharacterized protein n=1 Tax=Capitella teleta TaxID=283909 RepID=R7UYC2_CAPTE|nr:hypothetical protein CAPTEDRAFT_215909 [Capitella teleta]|eukprot:ELU11309.1 hypothetical protein CAPTEDRAFT_215909 [Capitella teleta]